MLKTCIPAYTYVHVPIFGGLSMQAYTYVHVHKTDHDDPLNSLHINATIRIAAISQYITNHRLQKRVLRTLLWRLNTHTHTNICVYVYTRQNNTFERNVQVLLSGLPFWCHNQHWFIIHTCIYIYTLYIYIRYIYIYIYIYKRYISIYI